MAFNFISPAGQPAEEIADPLLHQSFGPQAQVSGSLLPRPAPNCLIGVEVRAVARRCQALSHRLAAVGRRVVPDHIQRPGVSFPSVASGSCIRQLHQAVASGSCIRKAAEVPELLLPSSSIHSTSPVPRHTAE